MIMLLAERLEKIGITLLFTGLKRQVLAVVQRTGLYARLGAQRFFRSDDQALEPPGRRSGIITKPTAR